MLSATPRLPEEDSMRIDPGPTTPSRSAASTMSVAALILMDPAKLKPSHLRKSDRSKIDRRSTYSSSSLKACGTDMTGTLTPPEFDDRAKACSSNARSVRKSVEGRDAQVLLRCPLPVVGERTVDWHPA